MVGVLDYFCCLPTPRFPGERVRQSSYRSHGESRSGIRFDCIPPFCFRARGCASERSSSEFRTELARSHCWVWTQNQGMDTGQRIGKQRKPRRRPGRRSGSSSGSARSSRRWRACRRRSSTSPPGSVLVVVADAPPKMLVPDAGVPKRDIACGEATADPSI